MKTAEFRQVRGYYKPKSRKDRCSCCLGVPWYSKRYDPMGEAKLHSKYVGVRSRRSMLEEKRKFTLLLDRLTCHS